MYQFVATERGGVGVTTPAYVPISAKTLSGLNEIVTLANWRDAGDLHYVINCLMDSDAFLTNFNGIMRSCCGKVNY